MMLYSRAMDVRRALLFVAVAMLLVQGASVPHTHADAPGLYNQEHDLTLYAVSSAAAALPDAAPALCVVVVLAAPGLVAVCRPDSPARAHADPRAPPAR